MKPTKPSHKSFKNLIIKSSASRRLTPNQNHGETVIPIGSNDLFVELPRLSNTYTYNVINTDEMTGDIQLRTSRGASLRGLILNTVGGLSIDKIETGTESITMESDNKDGSFISLLSNGKYWYMWSIVSGGSLSVQYLGDDSAGESPTETIEYAGVTATLISSTVSFPPPSLVARHTLNYGGSAEPGSNITVTTVATGGGTPVGTFTVAVDEQGRWTASFQNISNGQYTFSFTDNAAPEGVVNSVSDVQATNSGPLTFTTPSSFDLDPNENFDFAIGLEVLDPNGNDISNTVTIDSSDFSGKVHGETFSVIYTFTYDGTEYSKTIEGLVADDTPPSKPVISSATFDATILDKLTVTGTTDVGTTLKLYKNSVYLGEATVDGSGNWTFTTQIGFNVSFDLTAQANDSATPISGDSRSFPNYSALSDPFPITLNTPTLTTPTLTVNNESSAVFTNASNPFVLEGTTDAGSTITLFNGSTQITPISGPTYNGTTWSASIDVSDESVNTLTAVATKAGFNQSTSSPFQLSVDRIPPTNIVLAGSDPQIVYLGDIGVNNDPGIFSVDDFSATTTVSNWSTQVDATEGDKNVTYTITDAAGNSSTIDRVVSVRTAVIVPTNLVVVDNGDGTFTVTGDVDGEYADNLTVQIIIDGTLDGTAPVIGGQFSYTSTILPEGEYTIGVNTTNSAGETPSESEEATKTVTNPNPNTPPTLTVYSGISPNGVEILEGQRVLIDINEPFNHYALSTDLEDGNLTPALISDGGFDNTVPGLYTFEYSVTDSRGSTVTKSFEVSVWDDLNGVEDSLGTTGANLQFGSQLNGGILDLSAGVAAFFSHYPNMADLQQQSDFQGNISYEAWFNLNGDLAVNTGAGIYSNEYDPNIGFKTFISNIGGQYKLRFTAKKNSNGNQPIFEAAGDVNVVAGEWHHVVTTVDSNNLAKIYFDGQYVAEVQTNGYMTNNPSAYFSLGHFNKNRSNQLRGRMDGVNVDNTSVWSDTEILAKYQAIAGTI